MTPEQLSAKLDELIQAWEGECVEFKEANDNYSTHDIGKYFSALSNEANLRGREVAWLVFGVNNKTRTIVGTTYREEHERLQRLKHDLAQNVDPSTSFRDIHELQTAQGRVILFEIPAAPRGIPIAWQRHYYARDGESLTGLSLAKQDEIRAQDAATDWSAVICPGATLDDLDPDAIAKAREIFIGKYQDRIPEATVREWDNATFLDQAKLTVQGKITRATLLLLGRSQSTHFLNPYAAELSWKLEGEERAYEHFYPPFLLETSRLFQRIRNLRLSFLPPGQLIPIDVPKYDQSIVLEALHNCIAHQDYSRCERVLVIERVGELVFQNAGNFFDGSPQDYFDGQRMPRRYRNRFLAEAMTTLRMIDTMGFGIREIMFKGQANRFLPLPDFDLSEAGHVSLHIQGRFLDENYSRTLLSHANLGWDEILALDAVQKGKVLDEDKLQSLRRRGLVEGRRTRLHVATEIAAATDTEAEYIRHRAFDDRYFCDLILDYLKTFGEGRRADFDRLLAGKLSELLSEQQKDVKIKHLLQRLRREQKIELTGGKTKAGVWRLKADA
ncbi:MAG: putative DNA binding domain-containing protein [Rhodocyclaceae bacterium]|nr:putative DNA binding domain-containing protein [Rhodocyclaceae bacterium]